MQADDAGRASRFRDPNWAVISYIGLSLLSLSGSWAQRTAIAWLVWSLTKSELWLGIVAFSEIFPVFVLGLLGGVLVDRYDRKHLLIATQAGVSAVALALALAADLEWASLWVLIGATVLSGALHAVIHPLRLTVPPLLVSPGSLSAAVAASSLVFNLARFSGPAVAAPLIAWGGAEAVFWFAAATYLMMLAGLLPLSIPAHVPRETTSSVAEDLRASLDYVVRTAVVARMMILATVISLLCRPALELLAAIAEQRYGAGVSGFAQLTAMVGLGAGLGGTVLGLFAGRRSGIGISYASTLASCAAVGALVAATGLPAGLALAATAGAAVSTTGIVTQTIIQRSVPEGMRGRIVSVWAMLGQGGLSLGTLGLGWWAQEWGILNAFVLSTVGGAVLTIYLWSTHARVRP